MENWQSEFLQFSLFIAATIWLVQKGSNESKVLEDAGLESKQQQKIGRNAAADSPRWAKFDDWRTRVYENSLLIVMTAIFFATWLAQSLNNWREFNDDAAAARRPGRRLDELSRSTPTSGSGRCRTGSRSSSPSGRWSCSRSTCASAARPNRSLSARRTTKPAPPASTVSETTLARCQRRVWHPRLR